MSRKLNKQDIIIGDCITYPTESTRKFGIITKLNIIDSVITANVDLFYPREQSVIIHDVLGCTSGKKIIDEIYSSSEEVKEKYPEFFI